MDVSMLLGKKMLLGWTLLDVVCASCKVVPLMEDKKRNYTECVQCHRTFQRQDGELVETTTTKKEQQPIEETKKIDKTYKEIDLEEYREQMSRNTNNNNTNIMISKLQQPSQQQQQKPVSQQQNAITIEQDYDDEYDYDYDYDDEPLTEQEKILLEKRMKKSDEVSAKMGEKLLLGWTMLGEVCPNQECLGAPLMKNRDKKFVCVSCNNTGDNVIDLVQKPAQVPQVAVEKKQQHSTPTEISPIKEPILKKQRKDLDIVTDTHSSSNNNSSNSTQSYSASPVSATKMSITNCDSISIASNSSCSTTSSKLLHEEIKEMPMIVDKTLETLFSKLKQVETRLNNIDNNHIQDTKNDCQLVRECSLAISTLLDLKKQIING